MPQRRGLERGHGEGVNCVGHGGQGCETGKDLPCVHLLERLSAAVQVELEQARGTAQ